MTHWEPCSMALNNMLSSDWLKLHMTEHNSQWVAVTSLCEECVSGSKKIAVKKD